MKAIFKTGKELSARDIDLQALKTGQIRLQVEACGICGTDIHSSTDKEEQFGQRIKPDDYSKRGERLAKGLTIGGELATKIKNCTAARYLSAKEDDLFTDEEVKERCRCRGQQSPTDGIAKAHYVA